MNKKLLILDDEPEVLDAYREILSPRQDVPRAIRSSRRTNAVAVTAEAPETLPFEIEYFSTGLDALKAMEESLKKGAPYAGGFFDVKLGDGIDGIETIRRAKELDPHFLCIIVTAYQDRSVEEITRIFGDDFTDRWTLLNKPFTRAEIVQRANHLISDWDRRKREKEYLKKIQEQQEQLIRAERLAAAGTMARGIGHEFGNILLRILGKSELALTKKDPIEMENALKIIMSSAERAGVIVRNLQSLVKMEAKREEGFLTTPLDEGIELIGHEFKKAKIEVIKQYDPTLPKILMNKVEIGQVFLNLLINSIHAMENTGGKLHLKTSCNSDRIIAEVIDTGCGIEPQNLEKIFEPLFTTKGVRGSGIGLSVSKKIVENHGGTICVSSTIGKGTTFTIFFPKLKQG